MFSNSNGRDERKIGPVAISVIAVVLLLAIYFVLASFFTVKSTEKAFLTTFGEMGSEIYSDGLHFKNPLSAAVRMDISEQRTDSMAAAASKDLQNVDVNVAVNWTLDPALVRETYKTYGGSDLALVRVKVVEPAIQEVAKASISKFTVNELVEKRKEFSDMLNAALVEKVRWKNVLIVENGVNVMNFAFSKSFNDAIEAKVTADQDAQRALKQLERIKAEAEQKVVTAKAEAESIRIQTQAIKEAGGQEYVELKRIEKWDGKLPTTVTNGTPLLNIK